VLQLRHLAVLESIHCLNIIQQRFIERRGKPNETKRTFAVKVMFSSWQFQLSSHSTMEPR
jgi:hypothetical protein